MPSVPTTADLSRIYDIAKVGTTPSLAGIGQRTTFDLGTVKAASVKDPVTVLSGFASAPRWTPPSMPKFASGLEPTKFDFIKSSASAVPTTADLSRIYDIAKVGTTPSLAGIGQRTTFDLGTVKAASVKDPVTVLSGFASAPRWTPPSMPKFASGLEPTKFDFIKVFPAASIASSEEGIEAEDFSEVAGSTWSFAERLGTWAQNLPDRETRDILLNLGGVLVSLAGSAVSLKAGGGAPLAVAVAWMIYYIGALINSIIDKLAA